MLDKVTILITTFLRDGCLFECVKRIRKNLPEVQILVVDDGDLPAEKDIWALDEVLKGNFVYFQMPFDSGLPVKRNTGARLASTPYVLMGCDDFDFGTAEARTGIEKLVKVLDENEDVQVASGRHNNNPYEGSIEIIPGVAMVEHRFIKPAEPAEFYQVELTVNYFLIRLETMRQYDWDERMKIGGEHGDWFLDLKAGGVKVVWVPGVNITEFKGSVDPRYAQFRGRAKNLGHKIFLEKRGVKNYIGFPPLTYLK